MDRVYNGEFQTGVTPWRIMEEGGAYSPSLRKTDNSHWADYVLRELATEYNIGSIVFKLLQY